MSKKTSSSNESAAKLVVPPVSMVTSGGRAVGGVRAVAIVSLVGARRLIVWATLRERMDIASSALVPDDLNRTTAVAR